MRTGHLFAGGGGGLYADLILGHTPVFAVEWDPYACAILRSRASDGWFPGLRVHEGDVRLFDPSEYAGAVDCIHAGFPCQDISAAGRRAGINGQRSSLYREVLRIAGILRPRYIMLENSPRILVDGCLGVVLGDLAELGYDARWTCLAAEEVGAPHPRERWWCLATDADRLRRREQPIPRRENSANPFDHGEEWAAAWPSPWSAPPSLGRLVHGMANRRDQIRALGNGQVPLCAAVAWKLLEGPQGP